MTLIRGPVPRLSLSFLFLSLLLFSVELYYDTLREYFGRVISNMIVVLNALMSLGV